MNRSFISVIAGGFGADDSGAGGGEAKEQRPYKQGSAADAAFMLEQAEKVIIIPGYGMAVAQAQHALREMADMLDPHGMHDQNNDVFHHPLRQPWQLDGDDLEDED